MTEIHKHKVLIYMNNFFSARRLPLGAIHVSQQVINSVRKRCKFQNKNPISNPMENVLHVECTTNVGDLVD